MYIFKNVYLNITRCKGRNILIGIIITVITIGACISLSIYHSGNRLVESYHNSNPIEVSFQLDSMSLRNMSDEEKEAFTTMKIEDVLNYGTSSLVLDYYYTLETSLSSDDISAVNYSEMLQKEQNEDSMQIDKGKDKRNIGDFRLTSYSNTSYIEDFISGIRKITSGEMIHENSEKYSLVMSEELAIANELEVGDTITFYQGDEDIKSTFTIVGLFSDDNEIESSGFMNINAMNTRNQMFTTMETMQELLGEDDSTNVFSNNLTAKFYLKSVDDIDAFHSEVTKKGLSTYYKLTTNEESVAEILKPIQNITHFSLTFLIVILIVGAIILTIIHMINIRERKYEIGVLRAIGMSKTKVTIQLISEIFAVSVVALIVGSFLGNLITQPITNQILKSEIDSYRTEQASQIENFGGAGFGRPGFHEIQSDSTNVNYVENLDIKFDLETMLQLFGISLLLTILSGLVSIMFVNQYEPNKILQNRA